MEIASAARSPEARAEFAPRLTAVRLAVGLVLLALAVRWVGLGARPLWLDEAYSAWFASRSWHELWAVVPTYEPHPPFYYSLLKLWRDLFGGSAEALRALSLLFGVLTVPVVIAAAFELERHKSTGRPLLRAGIAAFLAACSPMLVLLDQEARPYPLLILAYAIATLGLLRLLREFADDGAGHWRSWLMLAAGTELALWAHGLGALYALCLASALAPAWLKSPVTKPRLLRGMATAALVGILYLPCLLMMMNRAGDWGTGWLSWQPVMLLQLIGLYAIPAEALTVASAIAALVLLLLIKRAIQSGLSTSGWNAERALLVLWWGPPLLAVLISALVMPIFLPRTLAATLAPAYLAIAGAIAGSESRRERFALSAALIVTMVPTAVQVALRPSTERWDDVSAYLQRNVGPGDEAWLYPNDSALPLREVGSADFRRRGIPGDYPATGFKGPIRAGSPAVVSLTQAQATRIARDPATRDIPTIWLVTRQSGLFDPSNDLPRALASVRRPGRTQRWDYIVVQPFTRR